MTATIESLFEDRLRKMVAINAINQGVQRLCRERTAIEREVDKIDASAAKLKREAGIPTSEWIKNELRQDHEAWHEESVIDDPDDVRCNSRSPESGSQCSYRQGHDLRWGHEHAAEVLDADENSLGFTYTSWADYDENA